MENSIGSTELTYDDYLSFLVNGSFNNYSYSILGDIGFDPNELTKPLTFPFESGDSVDENGVYRNFIFLGLYVVTLIFGLSGNTFLLCIFLKVRRLGLKTSSLLLGLTLSHIAVLGLCVPLTLIERFKGDWIHGKIACKLVPYLQGCAVYSSSLIICVIALMYALSKHQNPSLKSLTPRKETVIISGLWLVASSMPIPFALYTEHHSMVIMGVSFNLCKEAWPSDWHRNVYNILQFLLLCGMPILAIISSVKRCGDRNQQVPGSPSSSSNTDSRPNSHRAKAPSAALYLVIFYLLFMLPYQIVLIYLDMNYHKEALAQLAFYGFPFTMWLAHSITVIHPFIYCASTKAYRNILCMRSASQVEESLGLFTRDWYVPEDASDSGDANGSLVVYKVTVL